MSKNKTIFFFVILGILFLWACTATFLLYRQSFFSPKVKIAEETAQSELTFLRQFIQQYFTYDSNNFWQTQTSLTGLMDEALKDRRLKEISLLKDRSNKNDFLQTVELISIQAVANNRHLAKVRVTSYEEQRKNEILAQLEITLAPSAPSTENPWGFKVRQLVVKSLMSAKEDFSTRSQFLIAKNQTLNLVFPCAVENISGLSENAWKYRIVTTHTSEVQITRLHELEEQSSVSVNCPDKVFSFSIGAPKDYPNDLYQAIPLKMGSQRIIKAKSAPSIPKVDRKTIEEELNFIISE